MKNKLITYALVLCFTSEVNALTESQILKKCSDSPNYIKRSNASVKKLEVRLKKYKAGSPPALAIEDQIVQTKNRFKKYADQGLVCGNDGLPHLIIAGDSKHFGEFIEPGLLFLYITGWIGYAGRNYLKTVSVLPDSAEKEIIIDVPLALKIMFSSYIWPINAWKEFKNGTFVAKTENITVSPR
jgi:photosystem I subunit 3|tara:strand:- start:1102 stop:1653 length:552 start_codon:yes stop_codon:yes gene_type:complete